MKGWTEEETDQLNSYLASGLSIAEITDKLGRSLKSVHGKIAWMRMTQDQLEGRNLRRRIARRSNSKRIHDISSEPPSEEAIAERETRLAAPVRDLAGFVFGDPPIGYSALDRQHD